MKLTPGYTDEERERYWTNIINRARRHPEGITAYCKSCEVEKNNYYQWFKKLRKKHPEWTDLNQDSSHQTKMAKAKQRQKLPATEVREKAKRRRWSPAEKARILDEIDQAPTGTVAAILRREGLYSSAIDKWRLESDGRALEPRKRGPKPNPAAHEIKRLKAALAKSEKKLAQATALIELQKKVAEILRTSLDESDENE